MIGASHIAVKRLAAVQVDQVQCDQHHAHQKDQTGEQKDAFPDDLAAGVAPMGQHAHCPAAKRMLFSLGRQCCLRCRRLKFFRMLFPFFHLPDLVGNPQGDLFCLFLLCNVKQAGTKHRDLLLRVLLALRGVRGALLLRRRIRGIYCSSVFFFLHSASSIR